MQITFGMMEDRERRQKDTFLDRVNEIIDFSEIEKLLDTLYKNEAGRNPIPPLILFKTLLLESWYGLSDVEVVEEIHDRRSFERFVGEEVRKYHVDDTTLVKFRKRMRDHAIYERVIALVEKAMIQARVKIKKGAIVDATLVKGATLPNSKDKDGDQVDPDVHATVRNGKPIDGYKVHVSTDTNQIIRKIEISHIEEHDSQYFERMLPRDAEAAYADKAYRSKTISDFLRSRGISNRILFKGYRDHPLTEAKIRRNRKLSRTRSAIERKMADLKRWCSMARMRYLGLEWNRLWVFLCAIASNLKRAVNVFAA
ncbi:MAG: IS5 family transposase [Anaerolineales bacterium]